MKKVPTIIYAVALLRTIASAISGFAIEIFVRLSGASDIAMSLVAVVPSVTYMLAALFLSGKADRLGKRFTLLISSGISFLATFLYMALFVAASTLSFLILMVILVEAFEGLFAGWFWPVLIVRLGEVRKDHGPVIRYYNLSWNLGLVLGNALVAGYASVSASLLVLFPIVLQVLAWSAGINGIIFGLLWSKFKVTREVAAEPAIVAESPPVLPMVEGRGKAPFRVPLSIGVALVALFAFSFNIGGILTNVFNQVTSVSETTLVAVNLLPWIPIIDTTRQMAQLSASGTYKVAKPALNDITRIISLMSVLALLSGAASTTLAKGGILVIVVALGIHGILSGILYNATMQILLRDAPAHQRGRFLGLNEAVLGLGFFVGPLVAGAFSQTKGYLASYNVLAGVSFILAGMLASAQARNQLQEYARVGHIITPKASGFPVAIKISLAMAALWIGFRILGNPGSLLAVLGVALLLASTGFATLMLLKLRTDHTPSFERFRSPRPHVPAACMPSSNCMYIDRASEPCAVIPVGPG